MQEVTIIDKVYQWSQVDEQGFPSAPYLDLATMPEEDMKTLLETVVLDDCGVSCLNHEEHGWVPLEPHCYECGHCFHNCSCQLEAEEEEEDDEEEEIQSPPMPDGDSDSD